MFEKIIQFILVLSIGLLISCSESSTGSDPDPDPPNEPEVTSGTLEIKTVTGGSGTDEDGYTVTLGDDSKSIDDNETVTYEDIEEGSYSIELSDLDAGCTVDGDNPISADVTAGETTTVEFEITCEESTAEGTIVFNQRIDQSTTHIFVMNADGSGKQQVGDGISGRYPAISPDGSQIAYKSNRGIWVVDTDGSNPQQLTSPDEFYSDDFPAWSPDGSQIVYQSHVEINNENSEIYIMEADGSGQTRLTEHEADDERPSWSPDGETIIFSSDRDDDGSAELHSINIESGEITVLIDPTDDNGINLGDPAWSPDGTHIAYQGYSTNGTARIFIADANGENAEYITSSDLSAHQPAWSPDGEYITFMALANANENTTDAIWTIRTDGELPVQLTDNDGTYSTFPSWGPDVGQ